MNIHDLYAKAYESNLPEDWQAYSVASRKLLKNRSIPTLQIDLKPDPSLDYEYDDWNERGTPSNAYARHWWGE